MQYVEPGEIHVAPIHDVKSSGFRQQDVEHVDILQFAIGNIIWGLGRMALT